MASAIKAGALLAFATVCGCAAPHTIVAHRGFSGSAPENTIAAFDQAVSAGAHAFELDVRRSADGEIVVIHDESLHRTTNCSGELAGRSYEQVSDCDAGSWFDPRYKSERLPRLADVLAKYDSAAVGIYIELKETGMGARVVELLRASDRKGPISVISFKREALDEVAAAAGKDERPPLYWLSEKCTRSFLDEAKRRGYDGVGVQHRALDRDLVEHAHRLGLHVNAWTVNRRARMAKLGRLKIDSLTTDRPDRAVPMAVRGRERASQGW